MLFRRTLNLLMLSISLFLVLPVWGQKKPLTQDTVQEDVLVLKRYATSSPQGLDLAIQQLQRVGIDFAPTDRFLQFLKAAGANEAYLEALRAAKQPQMTNEPVKKPLDQTRVITLLSGQVPSHRIAILVQERGIDFEAKDDYLAQVRLAGGEEELVSALKSAKVTKPEAEIQQYVSRGYRLIAEERSFDAEDEFRTALHLEPGNMEAARGLRDAFEKNIDLDWEIAEEYDALRLNPNDECAHTTLALAKWAKDNLDGAVAEFRETLRVNPNDWAAHCNLGWINIKQGDQGLSYTEFREALRLKPNDKAVHEAIHFALLWGQYNPGVKKPDFDGAIALCRDFLHLEPDDSDAHNYLGSLLANKGDYDGEIAEYHEVLRLKPNDASAHNELGEALGHKGDWDGDVLEQREAIRLDPNNPFEHLELGDALGHTNDRLGQAAEYREAVRLKPDFAPLRALVGAGLLRNADLDGAIAEFREATRLDPKDDEAHYDLGLALEKKGDPRGALQEYRAAYELNPKNSQTRDAYERLMRKINH